MVEADPDRRAERAAQGLPMVADLSEVPADTRACLIATPTPAHLSLSLQALAQGLAVLVEKPITHTMGEARQLTAAAAQAQAPLRVGHHRRCHPFSIAARDALAQIGDLVGVSGLWSLRKHDSYYDIPWHVAPGAGPLSINLSHEVDLLHFFVGEITEATALTSHARRGLVIEDTAALAFRFADGALGSFLISDAGASPWAFEAGCGENPAIAVSGEDALRFVGTEGALAFPSLTRWGRSAAGEIEWSRPLARSPGPDYARIDPLAAQMTRFAGIVAGGADDVLATAEEGAAALEITLACALSGQTGQPVARGAVPDTFTGEAT